MAQTGLRYGRHWRRCGFSLWIKGVAEMATQTGFARNLSSGVLGKPSTDGCHDSGLTVKSPKRVVGEAVHGPLPCLQDSTLKPSEQVLEKLLDIVGSLNLQKLGSTIAFQKRSEVLEIFYPAGIWQARQSRTWKRSHFFLQGPSSWQKGNIYKFHLCYCRTTNEKEHILS